MQAIEEENHYLKKQITCVICKKEKRRIVLIPCGHLAVCDRCNIKLYKCPICFKKIYGTNRTYPGWL